MRKAWRIAAVTITVTPETLYIYLPVIFR